MVGWAGTSVGECHDTGRPWTGRTALCRRRGAPHAADVTARGASRPPEEPQALPWPRFQEMTADWLALGQRRHAMVALLEVDVGQARAGIRAWRSRHGRALGFNAYIVACFARAVAAEPRIAALRHGRRRLLVFPAVDVAMPIEHELEGEAIPVPHVIRAADRLPLEDVADRIAMGVHGAVPYPGARRALRLWLLLPAWLRRGLLARYLADARRRRRATGTVLVTSVSLPGRGRAWGLPGGTHYPVMLVIGGLRRGRDGTDSVALSLVFDHDTVAGAPAARFARHLVGLIERGAFLEDD